MCIRDRDGIDILFTPFKKLFTLCYDQCGYLLLDHKKRPVCLALALRQFTTGYLAVMNVGIEIKQFSKGIVWRAITLLILIPEAVSYTHLDVYKRQ